MNTNTQPETKVKEPLYKVLNSQRTQGIFSVGKTAMSLKTSLWVGGTIIATMEDVPHEGCKANAEYTALAVNNLAIIGETLEKVLDCLQNAPERAYERCIIINALQKIS